MVNSAGITHKIYKNNLVYPKLGYLMCCEPRVPTLQLVAECHGELVELLVEPPVVRVDTALGVEMPWAP